MGMMTSLRRLSKKRPVLGILFVVVLSIGLIGSYAIFAAPKSPAGSQGDREGTGDAARQAEELQKAAREQISQLETEISNLQKELQAKPDDVAILLQLGDNQYNLGTLYLMVNGDQEKAGESFKAALDNYRQVVKINPREEGIYLRMAGAALYAGDEKLAEENFQEAIKADPGDNNARLNYGMYLVYTKGDLQGAIDQWQEILKHNPDEELAAQVREMIEQAEAAKQQANQEGNSQPQAGGEQGNEGNPQ